jgi:TolB protein
MLVFTKAGGRFADDAVFVSRLDGSQLRQLTTGGQTCCIRVSPDGRTVLGAAVTKDGRITTQILPLDGSPGRALPLPAGTLNLGPGAWTPDGRRIVVQGWDDTHETSSGMYVVDTADGKHRTRLTQEPPNTNDNPGDVSPDGKTLVFLREQTPGGEATNVGTLMSMGLQGSSQVRRLGTSSNVGYGSIRFSPDGSRILFQDGRTSSRGALWTIRPDGTALTKVYDDPVLFASHPTWSPDGSKILFALNPVADYFTHPANAFYIANADGSDVHKILEDQDFKREAEWFLPNRRVP